MSSSFQPGEAAIHDQSRSSPSSAFSSARSSPIPPLPDHVLRSFHFSSQQRVNEMNSHVSEALPQSAGNRIRHSRSAQANDRDTAATANVETHTQGSDSMDWSGLSNRDLDLIIANLEARASKRRNKIRRIEALSKELGLSIREQDWMAFLDRQSSESSLGIVVETCDHEEVQTQSDVPQSVEPLTTSETRATYDPVTMDSGSSNSSPDVRAKSQVPRRSLRLLNGLETAHSQLEQQRSDDYNCHEGGEIEEIVNSQLSTIQTQAMAPIADTNGTSGQTDCSMASVDGIAKPTAWSVVLKTYPEEIAAVFKHGKRPTNNQVRSMLDLPAVNALEINTKGRCGKWNLRGRKSRQTDHLIAVLVRITGIAELNPCEKCEKGCGLWAGCYTKPEAARLAGYTDKKVCANCMIHGESRNCRWKQGHHYRKQRRKEHDCKVCSFTCKKAGFREKQRS